MARIHFIPAWPNESRQYTACGLYALFDGSWHQATPDPSKVTCKTCQKGPGFKQTRDRQINDRK